MILNMSGGGASQNFAVVGGASVPENHRENTVWVETDTDIAIWAFSPVEPDAPEEGMVWLKTGTASPVAFNALKKNCIILFPTECLQYIDGAWVNKKAKSYIDGAWVDWLYGIIYSYGDEHEDFTGGLTTGNGINGTVAKNADHVALSGKPDTHSDYAHGVVYTTNPIDLTNFSTLKAVAHTEALKHSAGGTTAGSVKVGAMPDVSGFTATNMSYYNAFAGAKSTEIGDIVVTYDVSGLSGQYYVGFWNHANVTELYELILE